LNPTKQSLSVKPRDCFVGHASLRSECPPRNDMIRVSLKEHLQPEDGIAMTAGLENIEQAGGPGIEQDAIENAAADAPGEIPRSILRCKAERCMKRDYAAWPVED